MRNARFQFDFSQLNIPVSQIESILGYSEGESHQGVAEIIEEILHEIPKLCDIRAEYHIFWVTGFNSSEKTLTLNREVFRIGKLIFGQLRKSEIIAIFLCSAGRGTNEAGRRAIKEGDLLRGYIYDIVGSEIVEAAADLMQETLEKSMAEEHLLITNRYSPGYCGWDVSEQHKLFSFLPYNFCNIRLNESALMDPVKSVSGFIGIGRNVKKLAYNCSLCDMENCIYRRDKKL